MNLIKTKLEGLILLQPTILKDNRGYFLESYHQKEINNLIGELNFVQENESESYKGVLRGLHFQVRKPQGKLIIFLSELSKKEQEKRQRFWD